MSATQNPAKESAMRHCQCEHISHITLTDHRENFITAHTGSDWVADLELPGRLEALNWANREHAYWMPIVVGATSGWGQTPAGEICRECLEHEGMDVWVSAIECCPGEWVNVERYDPEHPPTCPSCGSTFHPAS